MAYLNGQKILLGSNVITGNLPIDQTYSPESENAQSGKAVAQALNTVGGAEQSYELIEKITTTEEVKSINFSKEPDGTPYNFKKLYVIFNIPQAPVTGAIDIKISAVNCGRFANAINQSWNAASTAEFIFYEGVSKIRTFYCQHTNSYGNVATVQSSEPTIAVNKITELQLDGAVNFPIGTTITIYGVRA